MIRRLLNKQFFTVKANFELLKKIRQQTSAPLSQCKAALQQTENSYEKALQWLKMKGMKVAQKHSDKTTKEGIIAIAVNDKRDTGVMLEVNCETDFVAKSGLFLNFVDKLLQTTLSNTGSQNINLTSIEKQEDNIKSTDSLLEQMRPMNIFDESSKNVLEEKKYLISKLQENIKIRRMLKIHKPTSKLGYYVHREYQKGLGLQGCLAQFIPQEINPENQQLLNQFMDNIAIQILGCPPKYWNEEEIPQHILNQEKESVKKTMSEALTKAPAEFHNKMIAGKLKSTLYSPYVFPHMGYVLNSSGEVTVGDYWRQVEQELNTNIKFVKAEFWKCK